MLAGIIIEGINLGIIASDDSRLYFNVYELYLMSKSHRIGLQVNFPRDALSSSSTLTKM